ncbi:MAG: ATP-binding protein, partial [Gaiellaceae bacterium]
MHNLSRAERRSWPSLLYRCRIDLLERDDALAALTDAYASAASDDGRIVLIAGEPGIGKTVLVEAFLPRLPGDTKVLVGKCDDLTIPRPLAPFSDLIGSVSSELEAGIVDSAPPYQLHPLLLSELDTRSRPTVLVIEDVQWADDATLDALTFLMRRVQRVHALVVLTLRTGEAPVEHPLHAVLGEIPAAAATFIELAPLSQAAVAALAGAAAGSVFAATRGNPFFVTELLLAGGAEVPPSVAHVVRARAARLDTDTRRLVELVSVVPRRVSTRVLDRVLPDWPVLAAEPERRHLLDVRPLHVSFRHELVRDAVLADIPAGTRRRLHAEILRTLVDIGADPADIVHHAEAAGDEDVVAETVLDAARRAAASQSNRQAYAHYNRAVDFLDRLPAREQAIVLEELASAAHLVGLFADAIVAIRRSIALWRELDDDRSVGRCTLTLSRLHWFMGDGLSVQAEAAEGISIVERSGDPREVAAGYCYLARVAMLADDTDAATDWAHRALELASSTGVGTLSVHALVTLASAELLGRPDPGPALEAYAAAVAAGERHEAAVALGNLGYSLIAWGRARDARPPVERAIAEAEEDEFHHLASHARTMRAWLDLRAGDWDAAARGATAEARRGVSVSQLLAQTVLAELAVRRGDDDAEERLAELEERAERTGELSRLLPVVDLRVERSLTAETPAPVRRIQELLERTPIGAQARLRIAAA